MSVTTTLGRARSIWASNPKARSWVGSSWLVGALLAVASWNVTLDAPTGGLDPSWHFAIYAATYHGMQFGTSVVFTFGPLGFLKYPELWYSGLGSISFLYQSALHMLMCVTLVFALRAQLGVLGAALVGFVVLVLTPIADVPTALVAAWCVTMLSKKPPPITPAVLAICGALLGAVETLVESRTGPVIIALCLVTLLARERPVRHVSILLACLVVAGAALWFATGQALSNLPDYVTNELQIVSGYSDAMGLPGGGRRWLGLAIVAGLVAWAVALTAPQRRRQLGIGLVVGLACFSLLKEAFVRADVYHTPIFFQSTLLLVAAARMPRRASRLLVALAPVLLLIVNVALPPKPQLSSFNPVKRVNLVFTQVRMLASPNRQDVVRAFATAFMAESYRLPPSYVTLLRGHTVHLDPWDTAAAWVYKLNWDPTPVFQGYAAYTSKLDELNARSLQEASGPQMILRENTRLVDVYHRSAGIDGRLGVWDPPAETVATLCNYAPLQTDLRWQVLGRIAGRCGVPRLVSSISARAGQPVSIPSPGPQQAVIARVHGMAVSGLERIQAWLLRARIHYAIVNRTQWVRVVPGTAQDGLLLALAPGSDYAAPFSLSPGVRTISFAGGSAWLKIDIYRMSVSSTPRHPR